MAAKGQLGASNDLPLEGTVFLSVKNDDKERILDAARKLQTLGFKLLATGGTQRYLAQQGVSCDRVNKVLEGRPHIEDAIRNRQVDLIFNTTEGAKALSDSQSLRQAALLNKVPYYTTIAGSIAATDAIEAMINGTITVSPLQEYFDAA